MHILSNAQSEGALIFAFRSLCFILFYPIALGIKAITDFLQASHNVAYIIRKHTLTPHTYVHYVGKHGSNRVREGLGGIDLWKTVLFCRSFLLNISPYCLVNGETLVHMIVKRHKGNKPISKPIMTHAKDGYMRHRGPLLPEWINLSPSMDIWSHTKQCVRLNYLPIPASLKFGKGYLMSPYTFKRRNFLSMPGLKLVHITKRGPGLGAWNRLPSFIE